MKKKPKTSARAERRSAARASEKLVLARQKLARLEPGGAAERPLVVESASVVEARASGEACLACGARVRVVDHSVETSAGQRLRVVRVRCLVCGSDRTFYFRIGATLLS